MHVKQRVARVHLRQLILALSFFILPTDENILVYTTHCNSAER